GLLEPRGGARAVARLPEDRHVARARDRGEPREAGAAARPEGRGRQDELHLDRRGHRDAARARRDPRARHRVRPGLPPGEVHGDAGKIDAADLILATDVETWRKLNAGEIKAPTAVMKGRLKFHGSMYLALRIHFIIG